VDGVVLATAGVAVVDDGRILLVRRSDDGTWCLPGGKVDFGEDITAAARRECREETGWTCELTGLLGVYSDPAEQVHRYPDGRLAQFVGAVFEARLLEQQGEPDDEVTQLGWFPADRLPEPLMATDAPIIADALSDLPRPVVR
jgi:8-oxo-dGTP diphosphatase